MNSFLRMSFGLFTLSSISFVAMPAEAKNDLNLLIEQCGEKTTAYGRDEAGAIVKVGEKINGYCEGYLKGVFAALLNAKKVCVKEEYPSAEFLLSTFNTYRDSSTEKTENVVQVLEAAFKRAYSCGKS